MANGNSHAKNQVDLSTVLIVDDFKFQHEWMLKFQIELEGHSWNARTSDKVVPAARGE